MSATATSNGKPQRKQLADQLDRMDSIIDALSEALPAAVADSCRDGARQAVKEAIVEIFTNPELRALIAPALAPVRVQVLSPENDPPTTPPAPLPPSLWSRLKATVIGAAEAVGRFAVKATNAVVRRCRAARDTVVAVAHAAGEAVPVRRVLVIGLGVGAVTGLACLVMPQAVAAAVGAVTAACAAAAFQIGAWGRLVARRVGLA